MSASAASKSRPRSWRAWHIFLHSPGALDRMLVEGVLPEIRRLEAEAPGFETFFIRYWENGPHLRFRLSGLSDEAFMAVGERLRERAALLAADGGDAPTGFGPEMRFDGTEPDAGALHWHPQGSTLEIPYEPEYQRYGGVEGIAVNESLFCISSALALTIVQHTLTTPGRRQGIAIALTAAALATMTSGRHMLSLLLQSMREGWSGLIADEAAAAAVAARAYGDRRADLDATIRRIVDPAGSPPQQPIIARWAQALERHVADLQALAARGALINPVTGKSCADGDETQFAVNNILFSQVHMMNNRLGVLPVQEYQFAQMLLLALQSAEEP
jgi:thiopeptide-type bacteriocin biosynthesis protein